MKLSELKNVYKGELELIKDTEFDRAYLVGKAYDKAVRLISFIGDKKYINAFLEYDIDGLICTKAVYEEIKDQYNGGILIAENPKTAFFEAHNHIAKQSKNNQKSMIDETAYIDESAIIASNNVSIGKHTVICANVVIKEGVKIGDHCVIREGCVIGTPAFYYYGEGKDRKLVESTGGVITGSNVELHANVVVEKGVMFGNTYIGDNTKIDHSSVIGHDTQIKKDCTIAAITVAAGGTKIDEDTFVGVGVSIAPNVSVGSNAKLSAGAIVTKDVKAGERVSGNFAIPHTQFIKHIKNISGGGYYRVTPSDLSKEVA
ncbi:MAG: hypothetical protein HFE75_16435 [Firmicutes bacterium]|nr:hypothetical protein [Bacillota bacterium]